jgi:pescadillo protein
MMSKKASRLYGRMQHGLAKKQAKVESLHKKRKVIDEKKGGKGKKSKKMQ